MFNAINSKRLIAHGSCFLHVIKAYTGNGHFRASYQQSRQDVTITWKIRIIIDRYRRYRQENTILQMWVSFPLHSAIACVRVLRPFASCSCRRHRVAQITPQCAYMCQCLCILHQCQQNYLQRKGILLFCPFSPLQPNHHPFQILPVVINFAHDLYHTT